MKLCNYAKISLGHCLLTITDPGMISKPITWHCGIHLLRACPALLIQAVIYVLQYHLMVRATLAAQLYFSATSQISPKTTHSSRRRFAARLNSGVGLVLAPRSSGTHVRRAPQLGRHLFDFSGECHAWHVFPQTAYQCPALATPGGSPFDSAAGTITTGGTPCQRRTTRWNTRALGICSQHGWPRAASWSSSVV